MEFKYEYDTHIMKHFYVARKIKKIPSANKYAHLHVLDGELTYFSDIKCLIYGDLGETVEKRERKLIELNSHWKGGSIRGDLYTNLWLEVVY